MSLKNLIIYKLTIIKMEKSKSIPNLYHNIVKELNLELNTFDENKLKDFDELIDLLTRLRNKYKKLNNL